MRSALFLLGLVTLTACGGGNGIRDLKSGSDGPDEFSVLPSAPLEMPESLSELPVPTPGARNRVDVSPKADAITVLGGRPSAALAGGIPASDRALVTAASRNGVPEGIRQTVTSEDTAFRSRLGRFGRMFGGDRYYSAYARQTLDAYQELERLRALGVETPTAPPLR